MAVGLVLCGVCAAFVGLAKTAEEGAEIHVAAEGRSDHGRWHALPEPPGARAAGLSELRAVRIGDRVVVVAGASYRAERVEALVYDVSRRTWSWASPAPLRWRGGMSVVGGPGQAIVWGGATEDADAVASGARYDPGLGPRGRAQLGAWQRISAAPIAPRAFHTAVWTGSRMIVWGGAGEPYVPGRRQRLLADGAAFDPAHSRWSRIPRGPLRPRRGHVAVWTGSRMIVWGGKVAKGDQGRSPLASDGAAYDPAHRTWTRIAGAPVRWMPNSQAFWTGDRMVVWTGRSVVTYQPTTNRWEPNRWIRWPRSPLSNRMGSVAAWTGEELLVWGGPEGPCGDCGPKERSGRPSAPTDGAAFDPRTGQWRLLPPSPLPPRDRHVAVGLGGGRAFVWGGCCRGSRQLADGALYRPGPYVAADVGRDLAATCRAIDARRTVVRCPVWLPAPARRDGATAFHVGNSDIDGSACGYLTELHLGPAQPGAPSTTDRYPFHVWFGGRCEPFPIEADDGRWPPTPDRTSYLGLVGVAPAAPGGARERLVRPRVVAVTSVRGRRALVLAVEPFPRGGLHGGHYAIVWNEGGDGYAISFHQTGGDRGLDPSLRQIRELTRAAASMRL